MSDKGGLSELVADLVRLPLEKPVKVTVERYRQPRSSAQNRTHWWRLGVMVNDLADETGHSPEEFHEALKSMFCPTKIVTVNGFDFEVKSTKLLTTEEMSNFMMRVEAWAASEFGYEMAEPIPARVRE